MTNREWLENNAFECNSIDDQKEWENLDYFINCDMNAVFGLIYVHLFPNDKVYVGQTRRQPIMRWGYNGEGYGNNTLVSKAIKKYGWVNVRHFIVEETILGEYKKELTHKITEILNEQEVEIGLKLNALAPGGYNLSLGNQQAFSEERNKKVSESNKHPKTEQHKKHISEGKTGTKQTKSHKENIRKAFEQTGKWNRLLSEQELTEFAETGANIKYTVMFGMPGRSIMKQLRKNEKLYSLWKENRNKNLCFLRIEIPGSVPSLKNSKQIVTTKSGKHLLIKNKRVSEYYDYVIPYLQNLKIEQIEKVRISYAFYYKDKRRRDVDNGVATINDILVKAKIIPDDDYKHLIIGDVKGFYSPGEEAHTTIYIEKL